MRLSASASAVSRMIGTFLMSRSARVSVDAVFAGHHHVHDDEVEIETCKLALRFGAVGGDGDAEAVLGEIAIEQLADAGVVIDHQQVRRIVGNICLDRHSIRLLSVPHAAEESFYALPHLRRSPFECPLNAARLRLGKGKRQLSSRFRRIELALPAVFGTCHLANIA